MKSEIGCYVVYLKKKLPICNLLKIFTSDIEILEFESYPYIHLLQ